MVKCLSFSILLSINVEGSFLSSDILHFHDGGTTEGCEGCNQRRRYCSARCIETVGNVERKPAEIRNIRSRVQLIAEQKYGSKIVWNTSAPEETEY